MNITGTKGDLITITGENLYHTPESAIYFNSIDNNNRVFPITESYSGNARLQFEVPSILPRNNTIYFNNSAGTGVVSGVNFVFIGAPNITSITPPSGYWRDTIVASGENFVGVKNVYLGETEVTDFLVNSEQSIRISIPDAAHSNNISIIATGGSTVSSGESSLLRVSRPNTSILKFSPTSGSYGTFITLSGISLDQVKRVSFSGFDFDQVVTDFTTYETTGLRVSIPSGTASNLKFSVQFVSNSTTGDIFRPESLPSTDSNQNLIILNKYISSFSPDGGIFEDVITVSGNQFSSSSFFFEGFNTGDRTYIPPTTTNIIDNHTAQIRVPKNVILGKIFVSGNELVASKRDFAPIPSIQAFKHDKLQVGRLFELTGINISECYPALFMSGATDESYHIIANANSETLMVEANRGEDENAEQKYFGDIGFDFSQLLANYPESLTTGNMRLTGIINANYFGRGKSFLVARSEMPAHSNPIIAPVLSSVLDNYLLAFPFGKERLNEISKDIEISGKKPSIAGLSLSRIGESGSLFISGNYFIGMTGIRFTDGDIDGRIPINQVIPFRNGLRIAAVRTGLEPNTYEKSHVVAVNIQDFNYTGKSGVFLLAAPYYEWV